MSEIAIVDDWNQRRGRNTAERIMDRLEGSQMDSVDPYDSSVVLSYDGWTIEVSGAVENLDDLDDSEIRRLFRLTVKNDETEYRREFDNVPHAVHFLRKWVSDSEYRATKLSKN